MERKYPYTTKRIIKETKRTAHTLRAPAEFLQEVALLGVLVGAWGKHIYIYHFSFFPSVPFVFFVCATPYCVSWIFLSSFLSSIVSLKFGFLCSCTPIRFHAPPSLNSCGYLLVVCCFCFISSSNTIYSRERTHIFHETMHTGVREVCSFAPLRLLASLFWRFR